MKRWEQFKIWEPIQYGDRNIEEGSSWNEDGMEKLNKPTGKLNRKPDK